MCLPYASLPELVAAIDSRRVISFTHKTREVKAEPHMIGQHKTTGAFILVAWVLGPDAGWEKFRFCEIRGLEVGSEVFEEVRDGFDPRDRYFGGTVACVSQRRRVG